MKNKSKKTTEVTLIPNYLPEAEIKQVVNLSMNNSDLVDLIVEERKEKLSKRCEELQQEYKKLKEEVTLAEETLIKKTSEVILSKFKLIKGANILLERTSEHVAIDDFVISTSDRYNDISVCKALFENESTGRRGLEAGISVAKKVTPLSLKYYHYNFRADVSRLIFKSHIIDKKTGYPDETYSVSAKKFQDQKIINNCSIAIRKLHLNFTKDHNRIVNELHKAISDYTLFTNEKRAKSIILKKFLGKNHSGKQVLELLETIDLSSIS